ncbi:MAG TPA: L,D-transpeptidase [Pseudolabrys sp.]|nr:L,D-transpeptidase [Pseudolabrys sp.]
MGAARFHPPRKSASAQGHSRRCRQQSDGRGEYAIHGTNRPELIGGFVSHGCIRMYNSDIRELYRLVAIGTPVVVEQ